MKNTHTYSKLKRIQQLLKYKSELDEVRFGLAPQTKKIRKCLCCGKPFESSWAGNRICSDCSNLKDREDMEIVNQFTLEGEKILWRAGK
jgi:hypothetical protein